jgi:hypothetical protein
MRTRIGFDSLPRRDGLWRGLVRVARQDSSRELLRLDPLSRFRQRATVPWACGRNCGVSDGRRGGSLAGNLLLDCGRRRPLEPFLDGATISRRVGAVSSPPFSSGRRERRLRAPVFGSVPEQRDASRLLPATGCGGFEQAKTLVRRVEFGRHAERQCHHRVGMSGLNVRENGNV